MTVRSLQTLNQLFTREDGRLETPEAERLLDAVGDQGTVADDERNALRSIAGSPRTTLAARNVIETFLARPTPSTGVLNAVTGTMRAASPMIASSWVPTARSAAPRA